MIASRFVVAWTLGVTHRTHLFRPTSSAASRGGGSVGGLIGPFRASVQTGEIHRSVVQLRAALILEEGVLSWQYASGVGSHGTPVTGGMH